MQRHRIAWTSTLAVSLLAALPGPGGADAAPVALATLHLRMTLDEVAVEAPPAGLALPPPADPTGFSGQEDWFMMAVLNTSAADPLLRRECHAEAESFHSRFIPAFALDFVIRHDPLAPCRTASYNVTLFGYTHTAGIPLDLDGDDAPDDLPGVATCPRLLVPPKRLAPGCAARIPIRLDALASHARRLDGALDGRPGELDAAIRYRFALVDDAAAWAVRVHLHEFAIVSPIDVDGDDWRLDADLAPEGPAPAGCRARSTTPHDRFFATPSFDLLLPGGAACAGREYLLRIVAYTHATESLVDLDGARDGPDAFCSPRSGTDADDAVPCTATHRFALRDDVSVSRIVADGRGAAVPGLAEWDGRLVYGVEVLPGFHETSLQLAYTVSFSATNPLGTPGLDDALNDTRLDGRATAPGAGCEAVTYADHGHFLESHRLTFVFRDRRAAPCAEGPWAIDLMAYDTFERRFDLNGTSLAGGGRPCLAAPDVQDLGHRLGRAPAQVGESLDRACGLRLRWSPGSQPADGRSDGAGDGFADLNDAQIDWAIRAG